MLGGTLLMSGTVESQGPPFRIEADEGGLWGSISVPIDPVWVAPLAEFFHRHECELSGSPNWVVSRSDALTRGLNPCPDCEP
jgi:hypothetical protein